MKSITEDIFGLSSSEVDDIKNKYQQSKSSSESTRNSASTSYTDDNPTKNKNFTYTNIKFSHCDKLQQWQQNAINLLQQNKYDGGYVVAAPSSGKTLIVECYIARNILRINSDFSNINFSEKEIVDRLFSLADTPEQFQKVYLLGPVRQLINAAYSDFVELFSDVWYQFYQILFKYFESDTPDHKQVFILNFLRIMYKRMSNNRQLVDIRSIEPVIRDIQGQLKNDFNNLKFNKQQVYEILLNREKEIANAIKQFSSLYVCQRTQTIKKNNPENAIVTCAIYESAKDLIHKNTSLVVVDESHLTQEIYENDRAEQICRSIYSILDEISNFNAKILFMSGTVSPVSAKELIKYIKKRFKLNLFLSDEKPAGNPSKITLVENNELNDTNYIYKLMKNPKDVNNVILLFNKNTIKNLVQKYVNEHSQRSSQEVDSGVHDKSSGFSSRQTGINDKITKSTGEKHQDDIKQSIDFSSSASEISNPLQRQAVSSGIGFIINQDAEAGDNKDLKNAYSKDQAIVAELFKEGKIHTILTTDTIGIGVNINVKRMYIPKVEKFQSGGVSKLLVSDASQLFNRVGRRAFDVSVIETTSENIEFISHALSSNNEDFEQRITVEIPSLFEKLTFNSFKKLYLLSHPNGD